jgi:hypothetical protein
LCYSVCFFPFVCKNKKFRLDDFFPFDHPEKKAMGRNCSRVGRILYPKPTKKKIRLNDFFSVWSTGKKAMRLNCSCKSDSGSPNGKKTPRFYRETISGW